MTALTAGRSVTRPRPDPLSRLGNGLWRLFTSVNFAVLQIIALALLAVVGMTIRQLPGFAFHSASDYATEMDKLRVQYEPVLGAGVVGAMERLQLFHVFTSTWFTIGLIVLVVSILVCTIDRTPRLWRQSSEIRVVQPPAYFDPRLPGRVSIAAPAPTLGPPTAASRAFAPDAVAAILRRHRFRIRRAEAPDGTTFLYGDRNRWVKMATLVSHLGLILFLIAGAVTSRLGDEQGLVVPEGETLTVQPIGTPGLLLVKNDGFRAPGFAETGKASDFTTDLAVYQDGRLLARKTIRVNDPLTVGGYTFHQNGFGPAPDLELRDTATGAILWSGPVALTDAAAGLPFATMSVPGRSVGLQLVLDRGSDGVGVVLVLPYSVVGQNADGSPSIQTGIPVAVAKGETQTLNGLGVSVGVRGFTDYTLLIAKRDPGQGIVWAAFGFLIVGLAITFYLPRRRVWARLRPDGSLDVVGRSDRYVDFDREFGRLVEELVRLRGGPERGGAAG